MNRTQTQFWRLQKLVESIRAGKMPNCLKFSQEYEVSQKTVQRDIDYIRDAWNAPIAYDRLKKGYYFTEPNWFLPAVMMSEGDFLALLIAERMLDQYRGTPVAAELSKIISKLSEMLPDKINLNPELMFTRFSFTAPPSKTIEASVWTTLVRATTHQKWIRTTYRSGKDKESKSRMIAPYHLANLQGEWYVFGPDSESDLIRQWSIARISKPKITEKAFSIPSDFNAQEFQKNTFGRYVGSGKTPYPIRIKFKPEAADWVTEREWHPGQKILPTKDGGVELQFTASGLLEIKRWVLAWGGYATVIEPAELRTMVRDDIRLMAKIY